MRSVRQGAVVKVAACWTVVLDPECYARHYGVELAQVRGWQVETVCCAVADLPGLCTLGAGTRWYGPQTRSLAPGRPARVARTRSMRVRFAVTVEIGAEAWARWAQVPLEYSRIDLRAYLCAEVPALACLANYGAEIYWHAPARPAHYGRTWWPSGREGYDDIPDPDAPIRQLAEIEEPDWA
jgi:hypothetical protein